ncbi:unnamed protein product [Caenorhabditis auriculariae]|uniref:Uncharacterized protein n=1 Tax=Caenorhabditis auriculariae TaxID=2777116 RepID=A0A8S1H4I1_9PELO|nr:unnamed protein product [Caenorhabditis auriculariae]
MFYLVHQPPAEATIFCRELDLFYSASSFRISCSAVHESGHKQRRLLHIDKFLNFFTAILTPLLVRDTRRANGTPPTCIVTLALSTHTNWRC